jgi:hypothetical protein
MQRLGDCFIFTSKAHISTKAIHLQGVEYLNGYHKSHKGVILGIHYIVGRSGSGKTMQIYSEIGKPLEMGESFDSDGPGTIHPPG